MNTLELSRERKLAGICSIPVRADGSKASAIVWKPYQSRLPEDRELEAWFGRNGVGIATICGKVSGNLEAIDIDDASLFKDFISHTEAVCAGLTSRLTVIQTPNGYHLLYRCKTIEGSQKLAKRAKDDPLFATKDTLIETKGEAAYVLAPGCSPECHETGKTYHHLSGPEITEVTTITPAERGHLLRIARSFNRLVDDTAIVDAPRGVAQNDQHGISPGDDYSDKASWSEILEPHGWLQLFRRGEVGHWKRPGKPAQGTSATTGLKSGTGNELLCVFSSNAHPFDVPGTKTCGTYTKFAAFALLNHGGDYSAAARALAQQGYGDKLAKPDGELHQNDEVVREAKAQIPEMQLPGGTVTINRAAGKFSKLLGETGRFYTRGGVPVRRVDDRESGEPRLEPIRPPALCSDLESVARLVKVTQSKDGEQIVAATCSESTARLILEASAFRSTLPPIVVVSRCAVLLERGDQLVQVTGYDRESGILASGEVVPEIPLAEAVELLHSTVADFRFANEGDRARALASIITPALLFGKLLGARAPIDLSEADDSQAGKGYRNKITAGLYRSTPRTVTQRSTGGVGSVQESFDAALVAGACFVPFDNFRGKLDLPGLESFLTEDTYLARVPYSPSVVIDPRRVVIMFTSNSAEVTVDLANRCSCTRILKQPSGYQFEKFREGDLLDHVRANQPRYLGAVFAVIREWHRRGKPELESADHDFRRWARVLGYISQEILGTGDLLAGHRAAQQRIASPGLTWMRDVALAVQRAGKAGAWLRAYQVLEIVASSGTCPELTADADDDAGWLKAVRKIGTKLAREFRTEVIEIDNFTIERREVLDESYRRQREYAFSSQPLNTPEVTPELKPETPEDPEGFSTYSHAGARAHAGSVEVVRGVRGGSGESLWDQLDDLDEGGSSDG